MILSGEINEKNQLWIPITVNGQQGQATSVLALVDTGFTGELQLPITIAIPLGLRLDAVGTFEFADGRTAKKMLFSATITLGTTTRPVTVSVVDSNTPLLGTGLLHGCVLNIDFAKKMFTIQEPDT